MCKTWKRCELSAGLINCILFGYLFTSTSLHFTSPQLGCVDCVFGLQLPKQFTFDLPHSRLLRIHEMHHTRLENDMHLQQQRQQQLHVVEILFVKIECTHCTWNVFALKCLVFCFWRVVDCFSRATHTTKIAHSLLAELLLQQRSEGKKNRIECEWMNGLTQSVP